MFTVVCSHMQGECAIEIRPEAVAQGGSLLPSPPSLMEACARSQASWMVGSCMIPRRKFLKEVCICRAQRRRLSGGTVRAWWLIWHQVRQNRRRTRAVAGDWRRTCWVTPAFLGVSGERWSPTRFWREQFACSLHDGHLICQGHVRNIKSQCVNHVQASAVLSV